MMNSVHADLLRVIAKALEDGTSPTDLANSLRAAANGLRIPDAEAAPPEPPTFLPFAQTILHGKVVGIKIQVSPMNTRTLVFHVNASGYEGGHVHRVHVLDADLQKELRTQLRIGSEVIVRGVLSYFMWLRECRKVAYLQASDVRVMSTPAYVSNSCCDCDSDP